jgi:hypothetical protein
MEDPRPFVRADRVVVVPPSRPHPGGPAGDELGRFAALLSRERFELEVELGAPVEVRTDVA